MKATVDPDSAEGRAEIDRLQHQILQIYQSLRGRLRRENRASLKSQRAVLIQQLESLGMATKEQKGGSVVFTPVASGLEATIDPGIVVQSILDPRKTRNRNCSRNPNHHSPGTTIYIQAPTPTPRC